jgi:hypothetical protein
LFTAVYLVVLEGEWRWWLGDNRWLDEHQLGFRSGRSVWVLPVVMLLWSNSHGGFAVGFILFGLYLLEIIFGQGLLVNYWTIVTAPGESARQKVTLIWGAPPQLFEGNKLNRDRHRRFQYFLIAGLLMTLAVMVNPAGPDMLLYPFETVGIEALQNYIEEWQSPNFHETRMLPFMLLMVLTFGMVGAARERISLIDFLLVTVFGGLALTAARNVALFALITPVVITKSGVKAWRPLSADAQWLDQDGENSSRVKQAINWVILILGCAAVIYKLSLVYPDQANQEYINSTFPVEPVNLVQDQGFEGRIFNSYNWGGYLIWALPERRVFIDGRTDLYGDEIIDQWLSVVQAEKGWEEILATWRADLIIIEEFWELNHLLPNHEWQLIFADGQAKVYSRY